MAEQKKPNETGSQPIDRLFRIIEFLAASRLPMRMAEIASALDMPQPTVLRYLRTLCGQGYVYHDEITGYYALTWKICRLSDSVKVNLALRSMASPFLSDLANKLEVGACLVTRHDYGTIYLDFVDNPVDAMMHTMLRIGQNAPIHTTGSGKVLMSACTERQITEIIDKVGLAKLTKNTITDPEELMKELERVREQGYGIDDEECEEGHKCVSVPLYDYTGSVAAAVSVFDTAERLTGERIEQILPTLFETARKISFRMGYEEK